ncbi:hypothetical protein SAM23877_p038 (plasmid) [Streptomyces ambofaciens ATCC 23877]|uniref:Uncharacterized protein n=1 Tax=Streptomyces ambofaciens (strain ATCC 23877 / 3486 / DSM 40053 / JCM 4204 / NBRC 12836 / NRRL B-2516) TaxID=278992 RepID=A0A0K2B6Q0_STRA7|nr:DUF6233 domain-containing protein [Streptomyces ambofaciens]AKZ60747.1 hypothetical protein SAM23877_p038 [Streptomyces ambofaciens ATCC 23877]
MSDLPPDERLAKLHALEEWLAWQLNNTRAKIRTLEAEMEQAKRQAQRAYAEARWKLEPARDRRSVLHRGGCGIWKGEHGYLERHEVGEALADETLVVEMCGVCNPEPGLRE